MRFTPPSEWDGIVCFLQTCALQGLCDCFGIPDVIAESVSHRLPVPDGSIHSGDKRLTYKIDDCHYLAWFSVWLGHERDKLAQYLANVTVEHMVMMLGGLVSRCNSTMKSPWGCTSWYPSSYNLKCWKDIKLQQKTNTRRNSKLGKQCVTLSKP